MILCITSLVGMYSLKQNLLALEDIPIESWFISDKVFDDKKDKWFSNYYLRESLVRSGDDFLKACNLN